MLLSYSLSYIISQKTYDMMYEIILTRFLRYSDYGSDIVKRIVFMISCMIIMISYLFDNIIVIYPFLALLNMILPTISYTYHTKSAMISACYDITHDIREYTP
jgi:hypothetical protein